MTNGNGNELPENRRVAVEAGLAHFQTVAAERDEWERIARDHESTIKGWKVAMEAQDVRINELESRIRTVTLQADERVHLMQKQRDEAIGEVAVYQALFISMKAQMNAFQIPSAPLVRDIAGEQQHAWETMQRINQQHWSGVGSYGPDVVRDLLGRGRAPMPHSQRGEESPPPPPPILDRPER